MQEFKYKVVGDTKPAVAANEALDASINKIDDSSKKLESSLAKSGAALELSLQKQDAKIKAIGGSINILGGSVELVVGTLGLIGVDEKIVGEFQKAAVSAIAFADGAKRVFEGYKEITEAKKIFSAITKTETVAEAANTTATVANTTATVAGTAATNTANTATKAFNATLLKNPYVIAAAAVAALVAGIYLLVKANEDEVKSLEEVNAAFEKRNNRYQEAIGLRNREAEIQIQSVEREKGAIAAAEERIKLYEDLAIQAQYALSIADEETANAVKSQEKLVKELETELARRQGLSDEKRKLNDLAGDEIKLAETIKLAKEKLFDLETIYSKALLDSQQAEENLAQARLKLEEEQTKKRDENIRKAKEAREKADKAAEDLAIRAVKQLEDQRQATEDLIELYTQLYPEQVVGGQFEFNTELDKTNFELAQQLDILFLLQENWGDLTTQLRETRDEYEELINSGEKFFNQEQLDIIKRLREGEKSVLQTRLDSLEDTYLQELALFTDNEDYKTQLTEEYEKNRNEIRRQYALQLASEVLGTTSSLLSELGNLQQEAINIELDKLERKYQRDLQLAGENQKLKESLTRGFEARELEIQKKALSQQKALRTAQVATTTAESVINAYNSTSQLPPPFNFIAGSILAAAYIGLGAKAISNINAVSLDNGSLGTGGFNNIPSGGGFSLPGGGGISTTPSTGALLPGLGGGFVAPTTIGTVAEPIRAYVLSGDVSNGMQAGIALNNRRRLSGG